MTANEPDPYVVLGISPGVTREEMRRRYRELAKKWHPDRHRDDADADRHEADRQMRLINAAYHRLSRVDPSVWEARERAERTTRERAERERTARADRERAARERRARAERAERAERERAEQDAREYNAPRRSRFASVRLTDRTTFHPVGLVFPRGREGYTMRISVDEDEDKVIFLASGNRLRLFRTPEAMSSFLWADTEHELTGLPDWRNIRRSMANALLEPEEDDYYDFDFVLRALGRPSDLWVPRAFVGCRDLLLDVGKAFNRKKLLELVSPGMPIDLADDLLRVVDEPFAGRRARLNLRRMPAGHLTEHWRLAATQLHAMAYWHD